MLHAGTEDGWIPGAALVFQSKRNTGDYHDEIQHLTFEEWFTCTLLPRIPHHSIMVMDNAPYHSRRKEQLPNKSWTLGKMMEWLSARGITYPVWPLKSEVWKIVECNRPHHPIYVIDEAAHLASKDWHNLHKSCTQHYWYVYTGHEVVRLPVAHCELNPIELAWSQLKEYVRDNNRKFTLKEVERLVHEGFHCVTPLKWKRMVHHVQQIEDHYWEHDGLYETMVDRFIINVGDSSDDSASSSGDSCSESSCSEAE